MSEPAYLVLLLDGPLQSWGFASRFERRTTSLAPTKSGIVGLLCAAMGLAKGSLEEQSLLSDMSKANMLTIMIPRTASREGSARIPVRIEDFHTVLGTRRASGKANPQGVITRREYLCDARFGVVLTAPGPLLERIAESLIDPVWGVWLGRKSCIPAEPISRGVFATQEEALHTLIGEQPLSNFTTVSDVEDFAAGTDSLLDQPLSFGNGSTSGSDFRRFGMRRIKLEPGRVRNLT